MKILELHITEFGGLRDHHLTLDRGLNIFEGENEAGKSTVWLFIKFMLYGLPRKGQEERERSVSRDGHSARGSMRVLHGGEEYLIERSFTEGSRNGTERLVTTRCGDGEEVFRGVNPGESFLKVPKEVFESTCGIGQTQCDALGGKKGMDAIRNLLSAADETVDVKRIEDKLDRIRVSYRHKNGKGGRLAELREELHAVKQRYSAAMETHRRLSALKTKMDQGERQSEELQRKLKELSLLLTQIGKYQLLQRFDRLEVDRLELVALEHQREEYRLQTLKTAYQPTASDVATLQTLADQGEQAETRLMEFRLKRERLASTNNIDEPRALYGKRLEEQGGVDAVNGRVASLKKRKIGCLIACLAFLAVGGMCFAVLPLPLPARLGLLGAAAALSLLCGILSCLSARGARRLARDFGTSTRQWYDHISRCEEAFRLAKERESALSEAETEVRLAKTLLDDSLSELTQKLIQTLPLNEAATVETARGEIARLSEFIAKDQELSRKEELLAHRIREESERLAEYQESELRREVPPEVAELPPQQVQRAELSQRMVQSQLETLERSLKQTRIEAISLGANAEDPLALADRIAEIETRISRAETYSESLELAISALNQAAEVMSGSITPALGASAGAMMEQISGGRYRELRTGSGFSPTLFGTEGQSVPTDLLSSGTRDAAYLCLRIALMMQIFPGELPPLMMDESLCQMDDRRLERVLVLLSRLCADRLQCLLFTCHGREAAVCERERISFRKVAL
ncbi:MAG: AAA family ATPase [Clostridia bacterium]|nr:AAA family ATPase [Clostridia bacterium]